MFGQPGEFFLYLADAAIGPSVLLKGKTLLEDPDRNLSDFKVQTVTGTAGATQLLNIPAVLACYWLGRSELEATHPVED